MTEGLRTFLDTIESPVLLLDRHCRIVFSNGAAETLLNGRTFAVRNGRLACTRPAENDALARAVANAVGAACGRETLGRQHVVSVRQADDAEPLRFLVCPLERSHPLSDIGSVRAETAVIGVRAAGASPGTAAVLAAVFGLTVAEMRLAAQLASGASLAEAAEQLNVSRTTVRTQLQSVVAKTETRRQADLMRVLQGCLSLPLRTDQAPLPAVAGPGPGAPGTVRGHRSHRMREDLITMAVEGPSVPADHVASGLRTEGADPRYLLGC